MCTVREFLTSRSGYVKPREGLSMGWVVIVLIGVAVMLGTAEDALAAGPCEEYDACDCCYMIGPNQSTWCCTTRVCGSPGNNRDHVAKDSQGECYFLETTCSCF